MSVKMFQAFSTSPLYPLGQPHKPDSHMLLIITGSTPRHSCLFNFPKWPLPSLAGIVTFYPDSKRRTSVNPRAAPRLSHVQGDGKKEEKTGAGGFWNCKPLVPMDGL